VDEKPYYLISLSAKTDIALKQRAIDLNEWLLGTYSKGKSLSSISYTLNVGRDHYNYRCAWVVKSKQELQQALERYLGGHSEGLGFEGVVDKDNLKDKDIYQKVLEMTLREISLRGNGDLENCNSDLRVLANLYVKGYEFDWLQLYKDDAKQRISLPTYPFARERHWVQNVKNGRLIVSNYINDSQFNIKNISRFLMNTSSLTKENILNTIKKEDLQHLTLDQVKNIYNIFFPSINNVEINKPVINNFRLNEQSIKEIIKSCISEILKIDNIEDHDVFESHGLDSISGIRLAADLQSKLHVTIDQQWLIDSPTLSKLSIRICGVISNQAGNMIPEASNC